MDIWEIYKQAFAIVKRNKTLWIFGMALALYSGSQGMNISNLRGFTNFDNFLSSPDKQVNNLLPKAAETLTPLLDYLKNLFFSIPVSLYILLGLGIAVAVVIGLIISLLVSSWAKGAAIGAINDAYDGKTVTLRSGALLGLKSLKEMIWLSVIPWLLYFLALIVFGGLSMLLFLIPFLGILLMFLIVPLAIIVFFAIIATQIWAQRVCVLEGKSGKEAFLEGFKIAKANLGEMLLLGCTNCLLNCCIGVILISALVLLIGLGFGLTAINQYLGVIFIIGIGTIILVLIILSTLIGGIYTIFKYSTWNILYRKIKEGQKNG